MQKHHVTPPDAVAIRRLPAESTDRVADIDRSEIVTYAYRCADGVLERFDVTWNVPPWSRSGPGTHSVQSQMDGIRPIVAGGGVLLGAFVGDTLAGLAIAVPEFEPGMTWLAYMHVSRRFRHRGIGRALWAEAESITREWGARSIYVSATPSGPTVDFYLSCGCRPVEAPHPALFADEPDDIHLVREL